MSYDAVKIDEANKAHFRAVEAYDSHLDSCAMCSVGMECARVKELRDEERSLSQAADEQLRLFELHFESLSESEKLEIQKNRAVELDRLMEQGLITQQQLDTLRTPRNP